MPARRLLIVTYHYPPDPSVGSRRWDAMTAWLRDLGHDVTVLTTQAWGSSSDDRSSVIRTTDLVASQALRRLFARPALPATGTEMPLQKQPPRLLADVIVPDAYILSWVAGAAIVARRVIRDRRIDCVITSGPPHSVHLLGLLLGRDRPAWVADFRDAWRYDMLRPPWPTSVQDRLDAALERRVARTADGVVGVTRPIASDLTDRIGVPAVHIPNGWDPRIEITLAGVIRPPLDPAFVNLVYTGQLTGSTQRDPQPFFEALDLLGRQNADAARRLRVVIAGRLDAAEQALLNSVPSSLGISHVGHLSRDATAALQRDADALLLLTAPGSKSMATGKLFEYLTSGRPILALADGNEAERIIRESGTGISVRPDDPSAIAQALLATINGELAAAYSPHDLDRYVYPAPAVEFADEIERALNKRSQRADRRT